MPVGRLLSQRSREAFSGMRHTATDSGAGFQREAAPFWLRRFQRQKLKRARNAVRGNNALQPVSIAKPSMMLSYDSLETGTGSSNSLRSTIQSLGAPRILRGWQKCPAMAHAGVSGRLLRDGDPTPGVKRINAPILVWGKLPHMGG